MLRSRLLPLLSIVAAILAVAACGGGGPSQEGAPDGSSPPPRESPCADGFSDEARGFCVEIAPAEACPAGTRPRIGQTACVPVGWTSACPPGTSRDASGWGCIDLPPPTNACTGASRMTLSSPTCVPVGDCNAAFPPAGALVVDDDFGPGELDGTHFKTIADAINAAPSGATIAIAAGTYVEALTVGKPLSLIGRCAAQVTMKSPGGAASGIRTQASAKVLIRGITLTGFAGALMIYGGADATIEDVVIEGADRVGIEVDQSRATVRRSKLADPVPDAAKGRAWGIAAGGPSEVIAEDVTITGGTDGVFAATEGTHVTVRSSIISGQRPPPPGMSNRSRGASAVDGAVLTLERTVVRDVVADAALVADGGSIDATETVIHGVRVDGNAARGHGISALLGGHVKLRSSSVVDAESIGAFGKDAGSTLELFDSVVRGPAQSGAVPNASFQVTSERSGIGLEVTTGAKATLEGAAIVDSWAYGAYADSGATLSLKGALVDGTRAIAKQSEPRTSIGIGITSAAATVTLEDVAVTRSVLGGISAGKGGRVQGSRVFVRDVVEGKPSATGAGVHAGSGGVIELDASAITRVSALGVVSYRGEGSRVTLSRSTVHGVGTALGDQYGHGIMVLDHASIALHATSVFDNAAIGLAASGGRAIIEGSAIANNPIGVHAQDGSFVVESGDEAELADGEVRVSPDSRFLANGVKLGSSILPLPAPLLP